MNPKLPPEFREKIAQAEGAIELFEAAGVLRKDVYRDQIVLDWECGTGAFSYAFLLRGAREVIGSDTWLPKHLMPQEVLESSNPSFLHTDIVSLRDSRRDLIGKVDFIFSNTVTEHIQDLPRQLDACRDLLRPGGLFFTNHDNYYHPVGSHDHDFLFHVGGGLIGRQSVACWEEEGKCLASEEHRNSMPDRVWPRALNDKLNPSLCFDCAYFKRSQPWAHLLYQDDFAMMFSEIYCTGRGKSILNKITPFQLAQYITEAGFSIEARSRSFHKNDIPQRLLKSPFSFSIEDLSTWMVRVLARKVAA